MEPPLLPLESRAEERDAPDVGLDRHREMSAVIPGLYLSSVAVVCALVLAVPRFGFAPLAVLGPSMLIGIAVERMNSATAAGVQGSIVAHLVWCLELGVVIVASGGPASFALPWTIAPCLMLFLRHPAAKATRLSWLAFATALLPLVVVDPTSIARDPFLVASSAVGVLVLTILGGHLTSAEIRNRSQAVIDPLTGLLNRRSLERRVDELRQQGMVVGAQVQLAVILIDIDHFKRINDTVGHAAGDAVLKDVAYELRKVLRRFDVVFRVGGEEFVVLVPDAGTGEAVEVAERLRLAVADHRHAGQAVTISIGIAACPMWSADLEAVLELADHALYRAKDGGRNRVEVA